MKIKILTFIILISCHFGFSQNIDSIDSLITESIKLKVFPGAQIYIKKNDFVYNKSYGFHTYDSIIKIEKRQPVLIHLSRPYDFNRKASNLSIVSGI